MNDAITLSLLVLANLIFCHLKRTLHRFSSNPLLIALILNCIRNTCAVFLGRQAVKDMRLRSCYEKRSLNLHGLINSKYFFRLFNLEIFY